MWQRRTSFNAKSHDQQWDDNHCDYVWYKTNITTVIKQKGQEMQCDTDKNIQVTGDFNLPTSVKDRWGRQKISKDI